MKLNFDIGGILALFAEDHALHEYDQFKQEKHTYQENKVKADELLFNDKSMAMMCHGMEVSYLGQDNRKSNLSQEQVDNIKRHLKFGLYKIWNMK